MRQFDLQRIRKEHVVTQKELSEMTGYPQGFISVIERGKASAPEAFIAKVQELFGIKDVTPYIIYVSNLEIRAAKKGLIKEAKKPGQKKASKPKEKPAAPVPSETAAQVAQEQSIVSSFLEILKKKEAKIEKLEAENEMLKQQLLKAQKENR